MRKGFLCTVVLLGSVIVFSGCGAEKGETPKEPAKQAETSETSEPEKGDKEEEKALNIIEDLSFFGITPEEASQMLGTELEEIPVSESAFYGMDAAVETYRPVQGSVLCGYPANIEFGFITEKTPVGTDIGLGLFNIVLPESSQPDLGEIVNFLQETYGIKPMEAVEKEGRLGLFNYTTENQEENSIVKTMNYTISEPNPEQDESGDKTLWRETCTGLFSGSLENLYFYMEGSVYPDGEVHIYGDARNTAVWNHLGDYKK